MESSVREIHEYPVRPEGYEGPLFHTGDSDREIMDHYLRAPWLGRASERLVAVLGGDCGRVPAQPRGVRVEPTGAGVRVVWDAGSSMGRRQGIRRVQDRWREVRGWWEDDGGRDLVVYRVELTNGAVMDLARDRESGHWLLVGIVD